MRTLNKFHTFSAFTATSSFYGYSSRVSISLHSASESASLISATRVGQGRGPLYLDMSFGLSGNWCCPFVFGSVHCSRCTVSIGCPLRRPCRRVTHRCDPNSSVIERTFMPVMLHARETIKLHHCSCIIWCDGVLAKIGVLL